MKIRITFGLVEDNLFTHGVGDGISYDWIEKRIYWTDTSHLAVFSVYLNGTGLFKYKANLPVNDVVVYPCGRYNCTIYLYNFK